MNLLQIEGVSVQFGGLIANDNVSLYIDEGEMVGLIGPNGAGKSTLFKSVLGFNHVSKGRILFNNSPIHNIKPHNICKKGISCTFQKAQLFSSLSVEESVLVGSYNHFQRRVAALPYAHEMVDLVGLSDKLQKRISSLNMFDRKKAELAAALATKPKLLLIDELFAGLVPTEVEEMLVLVKKVKEDLKLTIFVVEHVLRVIMSVCDRVYVLEHGKLLATGTPQEVANNPVVINAYLGGEIGAAANE